MSRNFLFFVFLLSVVFGLGAIFIADNWLLNDAGIQQNGEEEQVVSVTVNVPTGTLLDAKHLSTKSVPKSLVPEGAVTNIDEVLNKVVKHPMYAGDIVRQQRIVALGEGSALASLISENMRAITIRVNDIVGVAGFLLPGDRVDILNTFQRQHSKVNTEVVLSNIKILAVDQRSSSDENKPVLVRAVTVEVDLSQAEILLNARSKGGLQLALRNPTDDNPVSIATDYELVEAQTATATVEDASEVEPGNAQPQSISPRQKVEIIRGVAQESVQVGS
ncbi:Flp pilus assembly protein CpaB [Paraferrimonas sedimenticola]|uniref:Flp pilus assembly protein CpaB n=1 Tax=Paraferrimonas sedimenticola TaxID=375674 RepID=A0AA37RPT9_9GAMM|nr:Flp pilus assembly protein CpaB [Paraferrimonas sedimenticola]GLP94898.1 Flp pilus assembly protein CpaB [Paraferrimonas sedimenticola]